jgi:hypothetical protein
MPTIDGKEVVFRDKLPARQWWDLFPKVTEIESGDSFLEKFGWDDAVALVKSLVESWEFDGDPGDAVSYELLDFADMLSLVGEAHMHAITLFQERSDRGEAANGSI